MSWRKFKERRGQRGIAKYWTLLRETRDRNVCQRSNGTRYIKGDHLAEYVRFVIPT